MYWCGCGWASVPIPVESKCIWQTCGTSGCVVKRPTCMSGLFVLQDLLDKFGKDPNSSAKCGTNAQGTTTGTKFVFAVCKLMDELRKVTPHYVRCVKSNKTSDEWKFDGSICYEQLQYVVSVHSVWARVGWRRCDARIALYVRGRYAGVFQAVEIRAKGFPFHPTHKEFVAKYACIVTERDGKTKDGETLKEDRGNGEALVGTEEEQAQNIFEYTLAQMDTKIKGLDKEGYKWGKTLALYKGTWYVSTRARCFHCGARATFRPLHPRGATCTWPAPAHVFAACVRSGRRGPGAEANSYPARRTACTGTARWSICVCLPRGVPNCAPKSQKDLK